MKYLNEKTARKYQAGGQMAPEAMPAEGAAPAPAMQGQESPEEQLAALSQQLVQMLLEQLQDPNAVAAVLEGALQILQESMGAQEAPVFRTGGKLVNKAKCGVKAKKACGGLKVK